MSLVAITTLDRNIREAGLTYKLLRRAAGERDEDSWVPVSYHQAHHLFQHPFGIHFSRRSLVLLPFLFRTFRDGQRDGRFWPKNLQR
ncbi:hypothetical protein K439DRAFT_26194 [Ramaria rubella]|nr:hypothetical protein K439DRAFT_26194 [Ramaria rubella]